MKKPFAAFAAVCSLALAAPRARAEAIVAVTTGNALVTFDSATPGTVTGPVAITGLQPGETIVAIDFRPSNGTLYALGIVQNLPTPVPETVRSGLANVGRLYTLNVATGAASLVGGGPFAAGLQGSSFGFDFDPVGDVIRVISDGEDNLRVDPATGASTVDTSLSPAGTAVGAAHDRNTPSAPATTIFVIDSASGQLERLGGVDGTPSPNGGVLTVVGPLGAATTNQVGFDISGSTAVAYASLSTAAAGQSSLYTVNLATGTATLVGTIAAGVRIGDISCPPPTPTPTPTNTATDTPTIPIPTFTNTPTDTPTVPVPTNTNTPTDTPTVPVPTFTNTPTDTPTVPGSTSTPTPTFTPTPPITPTTTLAPVSPTQTPLPGPPTNAIPTLSGPWMGLLALALGALGYAVARRGGAAG